MDSYEDMTRCLHFVDNWKDDKGYWDAYCRDAKFDGSPDSAKHLKKHGDVKDAFWKQWQDCVNFGRELTADESRVMGWLHSAMTIGPRPKQSCTLCV